MDLDQYAYIKRKNEELNPELLQELMDFRKNRHLEDYMAGIWYKRGNREEFNCQYLVLERKDLENLTKDNLNDDAHGFFWGNHTLKEDWEEIADFKKKALKWMDKGFEIVYSSWW
ncbi:MAG: hypothetical protein J5965_11170 [Aeriscardovia sp.]|nr:hypothetical protein [Aeriscardovia sp.]